MSEQDLVFRLRERARIRRQIPTRKSVQEGKPDRIADLLEEAANEIESLHQEMAFICQIPQCVLKVHPLMYLPQKTAWQNVSQSKSVSILAIS